MTDKCVTTVFLSAAEASGDAHAAGLLKSLRRKLPEARFIGLGGPKMAAAGCEIIEDLTAEASMLGGPLLKLGRYVRTINRLKTAIRELRPDVLVPVDSPALNWHLASAAKKVGTPVMYYISPQVWAWAPWRVKKLARLTDYVGCILPFEQQYLRDRGVNAHYVGHPLFDAMSARPDVMPDLLDAWVDGKWRIALVPGSRPGEIRGHAGGLSAVADAICGRWPKARCTFTVATPKCADILKKKLSGREIEVATGQLHEVLSQSHFAVVASGTATLEAAYFGVPMVVFYRTDRLLGMIHKTLGKWALQAPHLCLVNILAGRRLVPELMPWQGDKEKLSRTVMELIDEPGWLCATRDALLDVVHPLPAADGQKAADNAADLVIKTMIGRS